MTISNYKESVQDFSESKIMPVMNEMIKCHLNTNAADGYSGEYRIKTQALLKNSNKSLFMLTSILGWENDSFINTWETTLSQFPHKYMFLILDDESSHYKLETKYCTIFEFVKMVFDEKRDFFLPYLSYKTSFFPTCYRPFKSSYSVNKPDICFLHKSTLKTFLEYPIKIVNTDMEASKVVFDIYRIYSYYRELFRRTFYIPTIYFLRNESERGFKSEALLYSNEYNIPQDYLSKITTEEVNRCSNGRVLAPGFEIYMSSDRADTDIIKLLDRSFYSHHLPLTFRNFSNPYKSIFRSNRTSSEIGFTKFLKYKDLFLDVFLIHYSLFHVSPALSLSKIRDPIFKKVYDYICDYLTDIFNSFYIQEKNKKLTHTLIDCILGKGVYLQD